MFVPYSFSCVFMINLLAVVIQPGAKALFESCTTDDKCTQDGTYCNGSQCVCLENTHYTFNNSFCYPYCPERNDTNSYVVSASDRTHQATATYMCNKGFVISGTDDTKLTTTCRSDGTWSLGSVSCVKRDCGKPSALANGRVNFTSTKYEATATYTCNTGYVISRTDSATLLVHCIASGSWSISNPTCSVKAEELGDVCPNPDDTNLQPGQLCTGTNAACLMSNGSEFRCQCKSMFYDDNGDDAGGTCKPVTDLNVVNITFPIVNTTNIFVTWTPPIGKQAFVNGYQIKWRGTTLYNEKGSSTVLSKNTTDFMIFSRATPGRAFKVSVITRNQVSYSPTVKTTTVEKEQAFEPRRPGSILRADTLSNTKHLRVSWIENWYAKSYEVELLEGVTILKSTRSSSNSATIPFTKYGHSYKLRITAFSETFNRGQVVRSKSSTQTVKTKPIAPSPPRAVKCNMTTFTTVTIQWIAPEIPNGNLRQYIVETYSLDEDKIVKSDQTGSTAEIFKVTGLLSGSRYIFNVSAVNEKYRSIPAQLKDDYCATIPDRPDIPDNFNTAEIKSRSFDVTWTKPNETNGVLLGYVLQVRTEKDICVMELIRNCTDCKHTIKRAHLENLCDTSVSNVQDILEEEIDNDAIQSYTVNGSSILPNTSYYVSVSAFNWNGRGKVVATMICTKEEVSDQFVYFITFSSVSTTSMFVTWTPSAGKEVFVKGYQVEWQAKSNPSQTGSSAILSNDTVQFNISSNVDSGRAYKVNIITRSQAGFSSTVNTTSVEKEQALEPQRPGPIIRESSDLDAEDKNINVTWIANGYASRYKIGLLEGRTILNLTKSNTNSAVITLADFKNGHKYNFSITAISEEFEGGQVVTSETFTEEIKTVVKEPSPPRSVQCHMSTGITMTIRWMPPEMPNGDLVEYIVDTYLYDEDQQVKSDPTGSTAVIFEVTGLLPGINYIFYVSAVNEQFKSMPAKVTNPYCATRVNVSEIPNNFNILTIESRSFDVTWTRPNKTYGENFGYVLQVRTIQEECVVELIRNCTDCTQTFNRTTLENMCDVSVSIVQGVSKTDIESDAIQSYTVNGSSTLPDTSYQVSISAINAAGRGNVVSTAIRTKEEAPQKPSYVQILDLTATSCNVTWDIGHPRPGNTTFEIIITAATPVTVNPYRLMDFDKRIQALSGLEEYWNYTVIIKAMTSVGTMVSDPTTFTTLPAAPGPVDKFNIVPNPDGNHEEILIHWKLPTLLERNGEIVRFVLQHNTSSQMNVATIEQVRKTDPDHLYEVRLGVVPEVTYQFTIYAVNKDNQTGMKNVTTITIPAGKDEEPETVTTVVTTVQENEEPETVTTVVTTVQEDEEPERVTTVVTTVQEDEEPETVTTVVTVGPDTSTIVTAVIISVAVLIAAIVVAVIIMVKKRRDLPRTYIRQTDLAETILEDQVPRNTQRSRPVRLNEFENHLANMYNDINSLFSSDYASLQSVSPTYPQTVANSEENRLKNRYVNVSPFDHSRVKLCSNGNEDGSDYINASYLPGYKFPREYIGCQGPIPGTIDDFWRMVWEQSVSIIVMLTPCREGQKVICEQYWPNETRVPQQYRDVVVEVMSNSTIHSYILRILKVSNGNKVMRVKHFQFLRSLDFQLYVQHDIILDFITHVRSFIQPPDTAGPMLVHCSAGVGLTGTYICLDHLMQYIEENKFDVPVDIFDMVLKLRENRPFMVQTEQQYIFIHECVKEMIDRKRRRMDNTYLTPISLTEEHVYLELDA